MTMIEPNNRNKPAVLKAFSEELSAVAGEEEAIKVLNKYLLFVWEFGLASYVLENIERSRGFFYFSYFNQKAGEEQVKENKRHLIAALERGTDAFAVEELEGAEPVIWDNQAKDKAIAGSQTKSFPIELGSRLIGAISLTGKIDEADFPELEELIQSMIITFSISLEKLRIIIDSQQHKTESLVESLVDGVVMVDRQKELVMVNQAFSRLTGLIRRKNLELGDVGNLFPSIELEKLLDDAIASGFSTHINEVKFFDKFLEISICPVKDHQSAVVGASLIIHDISYLKELDEMKTEFVTVASHKLRTPLTAIKLYTDMLMSGEVGRLTREQTEYLENIYQSSERTIRLVNDLLNLSKIESDSLKPEPQSVNIGALVKNVLNDLEPFCQIMGAKINYQDKDEGALLSRLDQNLFRQVIHNILINAITYTKKGEGVIDIELTVETGKRFILAVKDNGIGIADQDRDRIFTKFFRADNAMKSNTEGVGIGLYVAKRIVESSQGKIWFQSKLGEGTAFYLAMPINEQGS